MAMTLNSAKADGGLVSRRVSKMPGTSYSISARRCLTGSKLVGVKGSTCHRCYALKFQNLRTAVDQGWEANYRLAVDMIAKAPEKWAKAVAFQIERGTDKLGTPHHRWFASGDLQSVEMLQAIVLVCELTPHVKHWLPTREAGIVKAWRSQGGTEPANLVIRISSTMVGDKPRSGYAHTSTVHRKGDVIHGFGCGAYTRDGTCGPCRACWDKDVPNVSYPLH